MIPRFCHNDTCQSIGDLALIQNSPFHWKSVILIQRVTLLCMMMVVGALVSSSRSAIAREPVLDFGLTSSVESKQSAGRDQPSAISDRQSAGQLLTRQPLTRQPLTGADLSSLPLLAIPSNKQAPLGKADRVQAALPPPPTISTPQPEAIAQPDDSAQTDSQSDRALPRARSQDHAAHPEA
ncbi:MAG TPA: hypothetical protein ACFE0H_12490, partial [Elainellaceae cyanobacterium]